MTGQKSKVIGAAMMGTAIPRIIIGAFYNVKNTANKLEKFGNSLNLKNSGEVSQVNRKKIGSV